MRLKALTAAALLVLAGTAGCSGGSSTDQGSSRVPSMHTSGAPATAATAIGTSGNPPVSRSFPVAPGSRKRITVMKDDTLSGFGAALSNWRRHHRPDARPGVRNAYLPVVSRVGGQPVDRWSLVNSAFGYVEQYRRSFAPGTTSTEAIASLRAEDLPPDATRVRSSNTARCLDLRFHSDELARMVPGPGAGFISVGVYSANPDVYVADRVTSALLDQSSNAC